MKRCKDCGVELDTLNDGTYNRIRRCKECQKKMQLETHLVGKNTKCHTTWVAQYNQFAATLSDSDIQALVCKWKKELHYAKEGQKRNIETIIKVLETHYRKREGDRILSKPDTEGSVINESEFES